MSLPASHGHGRGEMATSLPVKIAEQGWSMSETQANFVWFPLGEGSSAFAQACQDAGLMVRQYGTDGVRVTIGEVEANTRFLEVAAAFAPR